MDGGICTCDDANGQSGCFVHRVGRTRLQRTIAEEAALAVTLLERGEPAEALVHMVRVRDALKPHGQLTPEEQWAAIRREPE